MMHVTLTRVWRIRTIFWQNLYDTVIPRNVRLAEAPAWFCQWFILEKSRRSCLLHLAAEMIKKTKWKRSNLWPLLKRGLAKVIGLDVLLSSIQKRNYNLKHKLLITVES